METLTFTKREEVWEATFTSVGNTMVEMERDTPGPVVVLANLQGMRAVPIGTYNSLYSADALVRVNVPSGVVVTLRSQTEVKNAKMLTE